MLRRALGNLVSNAIRHAPAGGVVAVEICPPGAEHSVRVAVDNPGVEIEPAQRERIFDRFYRIDPSRHRASEGAGLGLAIVRSIVLAHGGRVAAVERAGGARFEIVLPAG